LKELLNAGLPILIYNGDKDFICNWRGGEAWTKAVVWDHQTSFNHQKYHKWFSDVENKHAGGEVKNYDNFTFFRIYNAGHMVPMD
jgi:cathepsin A (carboxypeptidase C)